MKMNKVFGITDGSAGMMAQVNALADALGVKAEMRVISLPSQLRFIPNIAFDYLPFLYSMLPVLRNPKILNPDLVISCGRKAALVAAAQRRGCNNGLCKFIHIQDPQMSAENFDLVVAMKHDKITGKNVIKTRFALHNITSEKLEKAKEKFALFFAHYPKPHIAVLLGGSTNKYKFTRSHMLALIEKLKEKLAESKGSLLITPSRRTGAENIELLRLEFAKNSRVYIYDGVSENPYMGLLACADEIIVSNDSVNMMTEAFATNKKVTIIPLENHKNTKPAIFAEMIKSAPPMDGNEMKELAELVWMLI